MGGFGAEVIEPGNSTKVDSLNKILEDLIEQAHADQRWNKTVLDMAFAILASARDSLGKDIETTEIAAWMTYGTGMGTSWGQLLLGAKASTLRDTIGGAFDFLGSLSTRFYMGTNSYKVFLESQYKLMNQTDFLLLNGGGETSLVKGMWLSFGGGVEYDFDLKKWNVLSKFTVKLGVPFLL
jgi:hypothetical protein